MENKSADINCSNAICPFRICLKIYTRKCVSHINCLESVIARLFSFIIELYIYHAHLPTFALYSPFDLELLLCTNKILTLDYI